MMAQEITMPLFELFVQNESEMRELGAQLAAILQCGDKIALNGDLGAGKSTLARAIIHASCEVEDVPSPTFTLVQSYDTKSGDQIWHFDFYRLEHEDEAYELAIEEAFENAICLMEWPEKIGSLIPDDTLWLNIEPMNETRRKIVFHAPPDWITRIKTIMDAWDKK